MNRLLATLLDRLDLERVGADLYRGFSEDERHGRIFGGQVVGQALVAAGRTVEGRAAHSLHAYFLRPGDLAQPLLFRVERVRDGRAFATRQVVVTQDGEPIFQMLASFQTPEKGYEHQPPMPAAPDPESLPTVEQVVRERWDRVPEFARPWAGKSRPIDMRFAVLPMYLGGEVGREPCRAWFRAPDPLPDDAALHRCLLAYATDMAFNDSSIRVHGRDGPLGEPMMASLDHAVWFHADARVDEWLLFEMESPRASGARGFNRGTIFSRDGVHVASVAQDALLRPLGRGR